MKISIARFLLTIFVLIITSPLYAQSMRDIERELRSTYEGTIVVLKNSYLETSQKYDETGRWLGKSTKVGSWTLYSHVKVRKLSLKENEVHVEADRVFIGFDGTTPKGYMPIHNVPVYIEIRLSGGLADKARYESALHNITLRSIIDLAEHSSPVWNNYFEKLTTEAKLHSNSPSPSTEVKPADAVDKTQNIFRVGPKVSAPKPEHTPDPDYSELARQEKVTGVVTLAVIVDTDGSTKDIRIFKPIGFGLDEMACEKVLIWRFKPGMIDGTPVPVRITVETTFSLY